MSNTYDKNFKYVLRGLRNKYGLELEEVNNFGSSSLDNTEFVNAFVDEPGMATSDPNANVREKDIVTLQSEMKKADLKLLGFNKLFYELKKKYGLDFAAQWLEDEYKGIYFMHNSSQITFKAYCYSYPLDLIMERGLFFVDRGKSSKPEHYDTFTNQVIEFIAYASNRTTGAVGVPTLLVDMFYYWNKDVSEGHYTKDPDYYRDQQFQNFIYRINQAYIRVDQSPFTNVTIMDKYYIAEMFGDKIYPDGTPAVDYIDEIIEFQKDFMRVVAEIRKNQMMTFPVLSYALLWDDERQEFADIEFARWCSDHNMLWLDSNFFVSKDITTLSSCCRVTLNINDVQEKNKTLGFINSIGGSSLSVGSVVVNTTSMFNLALESKDFSHFKALLKQKTVNSLKVMDTVRGIIKRNVEKGIGKIYQSGLINMNNQYNTLGIASLYEAIEYFGGISIDEFGNHFYNSLGIKMANDIFDILNEEKDSFTANRDYLCNVEQTPIESAAVKLAKKAKLINKTKDVPYMYGNQWIPLTVKTTIAERTKMASILDVKCGGGSITHLNIDGGFNNSDEAWEMLNRQARDGVIYFAYNRIISTCEDGHSFYGDTCWCGKPATEKYTRVVGFITPVSSWQSERQEEFEERQFYTTAKKD